MNIGWQPIESAPKGGGADLVTDKNYIEPPVILLKCEGGSHGRKYAICCYDWYYAEGGNGFRKGYSAWVECVSGEQIALHYGEPTHWRSLDFLEEIAPVFQVTGDIGNHAIAQEQAYKAKPYLDDRRIGWGLPYTPKPS